MQMAVRELKWNINACRWPFESSSRTLTHADGRELIFEIQYRMQMAVSLSLELNNACRWPWHRGRFQ